MHKILGKGKKNILSAPTPPFSYKIEDDRTGTVSKVKTLF